MMHPPAPGVNRALRHPPPRTPPHAPPPDRRPAPDLASPRRPAPGRSPSDDKLDYATAPAGQDHTDRTDVDVWNYHFAGVVARSLDGADWVTLENYTRNQNAQRALSQLEGRLIGAYREKTKSLLNSFRGKEPPQGGLESARVIEMIQKLADTTRNRAMQEYQALGTDQLAWQGKWFFRLYGSQAGETFHDKQYASGTGDFVNPLTVRVRRQTDATGDA
ncbi:hypothetical protein ACWEGQ_14265 [Streptomyces seoulensis]